MSTMIESLLLVRNALNRGQYRSSFQFAIAGSNGYANNTIKPSPCCSSPKRSGNAAIDAPADYNGQDAHLNTV